MARDRGGCDATFPSQVIAGASDSESADAEQTEGAEQTNPAASAQDRLKKLRASTENALELSTSLLADRSLQISGRMMVEAAKPLREEYLRTLSVHCKGQEATAAWQAQRALPAWARTCQEIAATTVSWQVLKRFGLRTSEGDRARQFIIAVWG